MEIIAEATAESQLDHFESHFRHDGFFFSTGLVPRNTFSHFWTGLRGSLTLMLVCFWFYRIEKTRKPIYRSGKKHF